MARLTMADLEELARAAFAVDRMDMRYRWVMDRASYDRVRAAAAVLPPGEPDDHDCLFGIYVEVREDGGEPHLVRR
jgi:hypothetical protein